MKSLPAGASTEITIPKPKKSRDLGSLALAMDKALRVERQVLTLTDFNAIGTPKYSVRYSASGGKLIADITIIGASDAAHCQKAATDKVTNAVTDYLNQLGVGGFGLQMRFRSVDLEYQLDA